jgi:hypothetical protein
MSSVLISQRKIRNPDLLRTYVVGVENTDVMDPPSVLSFALEFLDESFACRF